MLHDLLAYRKAEITMAQQRLDKIIASTGRYSRREVKLLVREGRVLVDGRIAASAEDKCDPLTARIRVNGEEIGYRAHTYVMLHKPAGVLSATEDGRGETVLDLLAPEYRKIGLFPVGRLDKDTEGLLLLTDDGALTHALLHPSHEVEKEYRVWVEGDVDAALPVLRGPMELDGYALRPARVTPAGEGVLSVVIHEGRNRQVRRMCAAAGLRVRRLQRVREGELCLGALPVGAWRHLTGEELCLLRK